MGKYDLTIHICPIVAHPVRIQLKGVKKPQCPYCKGIYINDVLYATEETKRIYVRRMLTHRHN